MPRMNKFQIMQLYSLEIFSTCKNAGFVLSAKDIRSILNTHRKKWKLPVSTTVDDFLEFLVEKKKLYRVIHWPRGTRYVWAAEDFPHALEVASNLFPDSYLSHFSAVSLHGLTDEIVKSIYSNRPHKPTSNTVISQIDIDKAFAKPMRTASQYVEYNDYRIYLLNSGSMDVKTEKINGINVTNIIQTLIDITVRPEYCGGAYEVLKVFQNARGLFQGAKLRASLLNAKYMYPYHQCMGFYLEHAGYDEKIVKLFETIPMKYDFYLTYNMKNPHYSDRWKLYYPSHIN